jgi:RHS repeat-associated protein
MLDTRENASDSNKKEAGRTEARGGPNLTSPPTISLAKGGGAIRGMGEKFASNPVTGTGSMSVPLATSPGRSGFGPQLSLAYDSGTGNGPFGFGWNLSLPSITRKTDKGLPQYLDADESDVFILSGAEDLVPVLMSNGSRLEDHTSVAGYTVHRYRPRIEGLFARIERWTNRADPTDVFWRSISKDNIITWYGKTAESRITDPDDGRKSFGWLICETYDDKGNAIRYEYKAEDSDGVDLSAANEKNRRRSAQRYLKRIKYGNKTPHNPNEDLSQHDDKDWMFEVVFDYGEHYPEAEPVRLSSVFVEDNKRRWAIRKDPFSSYRAGFEVRTYRLCRRMLMFHHFPDELGTDDYLVRATHFAVSQDSAASFITAVTQSGYVLQAVDESYLERSLPPLEFEYSQAEIDETVREVEEDSLENLPHGLDGSHYQWVDLDGEGLSGILTEQGGAWFYKRNLSALPASTGDGARAVAARFAPVERLSTMPSPANLSGGQQLLDLAGNGQLDVVEFEGPAPGFFERTTDEGWETFTPFASLPNVAWKDPNLKFVDLTGDGHADILVTEDEVLTWYASLAEAGFGPAERVRQTFDQETGSRLMFADGTQSLYLSDFSGDGLTDLVRIRNGEVCYWPNLGYGRFGAKVAMDHAPWFDTPDQFDQKRVRLADIDGSGVVDIIYLAADGVRLYRNQSGNGWSDARLLSNFPPIDNLSSVQVADLLGNGTACLVWSSPLPCDARRRMRYIDLMGGQKPHLLVKAVNNLGGETRVHYTPSTKFYLVDKYAGKPWVTRLPFPVHVVERVETYDHISRNRFISRYAYHHGHFDGVEREFRGFGMVEQFDTEEFAALVAGANFPDATNVDAASHVPPVHTKTWFHTGGYMNRERVSDYFAGLLDEHGRGEYYREPAWRDDDVEAKKRLLEDTILPSDLTSEEEREACRALKGAMLRQEVYAIDGTPKAQHPYTVTEQNFTIRRLQPRAGNRHGVFFTHTREAISYNYERNPDDPRIGHALTLEVDAFGNVLRSLAVGYPRANIPGRRPAQDETHITLTLNRFANRDDRADWRRVGLPVESRTYEVVKPPTAARRFTWEELSGLVTALVPVDQDEPPVANTIPYQQWDWRKQWNQQSEPGGLVENVLLHTRLRLIEHVRTVYRADDLTSLLPPGTVESLALPGESYKLALTPGLARRLFVESGKLTEAALIGVLADEGKYVHSESDADWWIPSGRVFHSPNGGDSPAQELTYAGRHFFLPQRFRDPFHTNAVRTETFVRYDGYDLLMLETRDPLGNRITIGGRNAGGNLIRGGNDYRVLQPKLVTDPNRNRTEVVFDALGLVVGTASKGKDDTVGDTLNGFEPDLPQAQVEELYNVADPHVPAPGLLNGGTTRIVYDLHRFRRTQQAHPEDPTQWLPVYAATLARETHSNPPPTQALKIQISFSYSDGFGREIQKKIQAESGPLVEGGPVFSPRWVGSGWTIFNNKGKPVRRYEPFFSRLPEKRHQYEFGIQVGVSPILCYDASERVVATLHPNHTYEKVVFDAWQQTTYDVNDTVTFVPSSDEDVRGFLIEPDGAPRIPTTDYLPTWHAQRIGNPPGDSERDAAQKAAAHAGTPTTVQFDTLGRPFLTLAHNGFKPDRTPIHFRTRVKLDIEGNQREVRDAIEQNGDTQGRIVMRYDYDMLGNRIHQGSMEAGARWMLNDVAGKPIRAWDGRGHSFRTEYDPLRRPLRSFVTGADPTRPSRELLTERLVYGEQHPEDELRNLRGRLYLHLDQAGVVTSEAHDFKGNPLRATRRLTNGTQYRQAVDWTPVDADHVALPTDAGTILDLDALKAALAPRLEADTYTSLTTYDALNRPVSLTAPHTPAMRPSVIRPGYNEANLLKRVDANLRGAAADGQLVWTPFVSNIDYDAKGRRRRIDYGNGTSTFYRYDPLTFRLLHMLTERNAVAFPDDCPQRPPGGWPGCQVQNLHYTYDPVGNITHIRDDAQQTIYFRNRRVEPSADYTYDAVYRLIEATGREHLGQTGGTPIPHSHDDAPRVGINWSANDGNAVGRYTERFVYDAVGNFLKMQHRGGDPARSGWTRTYAYGETSLIEDGAGGVPPKTSNRLSSTTVGGNDPPVERYVYDAHGNMIRMPHLGGAHPDANTRWDYRDQMCHTALGGGGGAYYVYDASGQRVRKVWEKPSNLVEERIYFGGFELYRRRQGAERLERETLHVMDDKQRIALVETRTLDTEGDDHAPPQLVRYQFGNHLGSAGLELDDQAQIISYEEYTPYGSTSYQAVRSQTETPKRYRYTGKERDEESGLYYHEARYYAPWKCRWISCDPKGLVDGPCLYAYCGGNPITFHDPSGTNGRPPMPGFIGNNPRIGGLWERAVVETLGGRLNATNYSEVSAAFENELARRIAANGLGSNRQAGTGVNYARQSYSAVRARFGRLARQAGLSLDGIQVHHFDELARNPSNALNTANLQFVRGNAGTTGSGHNFAHAVSDRLAASRAANPRLQTNPGLEEAQSMRARGIDPDVPELAAFTPASTAPAPAHAASAPHAPIPQGGAGTVAETGRAGRALARARGALATAGRAVEEAAPTLMRVARAGARGGAHVVGALGRVAGPLAIAESSYRLGAATNNLDRMQAGADTAAGLAVYAGPVGEAFATGYGAGQLLDTGVEMATGESLSSRGARGMTAVDQAISSVLPQNNSLPQYKQENRIGWFLIDTFNL